MTKGRCGRPVLLQPSIQQAEPEGGPGSRGDPEGLSHHKRHTMSESSRWGLGSQEKDEAESRSPM